MPPDRMITVLDELEATRHTLSLAEPDDLVVICADEITAVWKAVVNHPGKTPYGANRPGSMLRRGEPVGPPDVGSGN